MKKQVVHSDARGNLTVLRLFFYSCVLLVLLCVPQPVFPADASPATLGATFSWVYILKLIAALGAVIGFFALFAMVMRRSQGFGQATGSGLSIVASLSLGTRERLVVVQAGQKQILVGITQTQINPLSELDTPIAVSNDEQPESFKANLDKILGKKVHRV
ncbi:MAG: flagellar biosynthetic protein FliO [Granulosicoccus sp.]|nr:flagellar biosynthetic protein FliO [Granulosicoccus sp.]